MTPKKLAAVAVEALDDLKAVDVVVLDVRKMASFTDMMVIASGRSDRQVRALADHVVEKAREQGVRPIGIEGEREGQWILVDLGDVVVNVMMPDVRDFYKLERLWSSDRQAARSASDG